MQSLLYGKAVGAPVGQKKGERWVIEGQEESWRTGAWEVRVDPAWR